jgi:hypothetical protein
METTYGIKLKSSIVWDSAVGLILEVKKSNDILSKDVQWDPKETFNTKIKD